MTITHARFLTRKSICIVHFRSIFSIDFDRRVAQILANIEGFENHKPQRK
jgi:hypothetical protein